MDITLLCHFGEEDAKIDRLLRGFEPRIPDAAQFARSSRVVLLWSGDRVGIDVALGSMPFEERCVGRASDWEIAQGMVLHTCSAEDLVVLKAFAGRPQDWIDVDRILARQQGKPLDWRQIESELEPLLELKGELEHLGTLRRLKASVEKGT